MKRAILILVLAAVLLAAGVAPIAIANDQSVTQTFIASDNAHKVWSGVKSQDAYVMLAASQRFRVKLIALRSRLRADRGSSIPGRQARLIMLDMFAAAIRTAQNAIDLQRLTLEIRGVGVTDELIDRAAALANALEDNLSEYLFLGEEVKAALRRARALHQ